MKILLINDYGTASGGAELSTLRLRDALRRRGHDARVFASSARPGAGRSFADYECFGTIGRWRTMLQTVNPSAALRLRQVICEFQPDVVDVRVFLTQLSPLILPLLRNVPSLHRVVWYRPVCPLGTKLLPNGEACEKRAGLACYRSHCLPLRDWLPLMLQRWMWRRWLSAFNLFVANSHAVRRSLQADGIGPVEVVWHDVPVRARRAPLSSKPTVAFAGRLVWIKGVDVLLHAFGKVVKQIPDARLLIVGDGSEKEILMKLVIELGLGSSVQLLGHLSACELERRLDGAWVQVVPSRWAEPFGIVAAEAMMRGAAVVASASGGLPEFVQHGKTGLLVPPGGVNELTQALLRLLIDRALAERMGEAGRELAMAQLSEPHVVDRFLSFYQLLCDRGGTADGARDKTLSVSNHRT